MKQSLLVSATINKPFFLFEEKTACFMREIALYTKYTAASYLRFSAMATK